MKDIVTVFFVLLFLTAIVSLGLFYWQYQSWPPNLWRLRLTERVAALLARRRELTADDPDPAGRRVRQLAEEMFRRQLKTLPVEQLMGFSGIGPGTVQRVRGGGCQTLADLVGYPFETLPGIGPVKARELRTAVRKLAHEARARFDAGASPEAQEYRRKLTEFKAEQRNSAVARDRELAAVEEALDECDELLILARDVSFWNYLFHRDIPGLTGELLARPLPQAKPSPLVVPEAPPVPVPAVAAVARPVGPAPDLFAPTVPAPASDGPHPWLPKLRAYARFGLAVARADGRVAQAEKKVIRAFLAEKFGHDGVLTRHIDPLMERAEAEAPSDRDALADVLPVTTDSERQELYGLAERIVDASGERNQRECDALARLVEAFELKPREQTVHEPSLEPPVTACPLPSSEPAPSSDPAPQSPPATTLPELSTRHQRYLRLGTAVAMAGGVVTREARAVIREFMASQLRRGSYILDSLDQHIGASESLRIDIASAATAVRAVTNEAAKKEIIAWLVRVAKAAGDSNSADEAVRLVAAEFLMPIPSERSTPELPPTARLTSPTDLRGLLEIDTNTELSPALVRRRYALLTEKLDPAKAAAMGPEFARMAEEKRAAIRAAAEALIAPFGVTLDPPAAPPPPADLRHNPDLDDVFGG